MSHPRGCSPAKPACACRRAQVCWLEKHWRLHTDRPEGKSSSRKGSINTSHNNMLGYTSRVSVCSVPPVRSAQSEFWRDANEPFTRSTLLHFRLRFERDAKRLETGAAGIDSVRPASAHLGLR